MRDVAQLSVERLHERHPGLTQALADSYAEAASVCWARHYQPPVTVSLRHNDTDEFRVVNFAVPDARVRNAYANEIDATETGAYGVSRAAAERWVAAVNAEGSYETRKYALVHKPTEIPTVITSFAIL